MNLDTILHKQKHNIAALAIFDWRILADPTYLTDSIANTGMMGHFINWINEEDSPSEKLTGPDGVETGKVYTLRRFFTTLQERPIPDSPPYYLEALRQPWLDWAAAVNLHQPVYVSRETYENQDTAHISVGKNPPAILRRLGIRRKVTHRLAKLEVLVDIEKRPLTAGEIIKATDRNDEPVYVSEVVVRLPESFMPNPLPEHQSYIPSRYMTFEVYVPESLDKQLRDLSPRQMLQFTVGSVMEDYFRRWFGIHDVLARKFADDKSTPAERILYDTWKIFGSGNVTVSGHISSEKIFRAVEFLRTTPIFSYDFAHNKPIMIND